MYVTWPSARLRFPKRWFLRTSKTSKRSSMISMERKCPECPGRTLSSSLVNCPFLFLAHSRHFSVSKEQLCVFSSAHTLVFVFTSNRLHQFVTITRADDKKKKQGLIMYLTLFHQDTYIHKTKKLYIDSRARRNFSSINTELQDVQRIMVANIEEVLQRGEALSGKSPHTFSKWTVHY